MKKLVKLLIALAGTLNCLNTSAALINFSGSPNAPIPDNNASGLAFGFTVTTPFSSLDSVVVTLTISGGYNGDLYAYLSHGSGFAVLLNRVGVTGSDPLGYSDSGFNVTLSPGGTDIHQYRTTLGGAPPGGVLTGNWGADGRLLPTDVTRANTLDVFNGANPNGDWTLYFADRSPIGISTLNSWSVGIEAVPEPANIALAVFGVLFASVQGMRLWSRRRTSQANAEKSRRLI